MNNKKKCCNIVGNVKGRLWRATNLGQVYRVADSKIQWAHETLTFDLIRYHKYFLQIGSFYEFPFWTV